jgi:hypothetical protein
VETGRANNVIAVAIFRAKRIYSGQSYRFDGEQLSFVFRWLMPLPQSQLLIVAVVALSAGCSSPSKPESVSSFTSAPSRFTFDGIEYEVAKAEITAAVADSNGEGYKLYWGIEFVSVDREVEGDFISPSVDFSLQPNIADWHDLAGIKMKWSTPINPETDARYGLTYVYDHQLISSGSLEITSRDGDRFRIVASGQNEDGHEFEIDAPARFVGIYVNGTKSDDKTTIQERLSRLIDASDLQGSRFELDADGKVGDSFYRPKADVR